MQAMDPSLKQSIASAVTSTVTTVVATFQARHNDDILSLREMIKKSLHFSVFSLSSTPPTDPKASAKVSTPTEGVTKTSSKDGIRRSWVTLNYTLIRHMARAK